MADSIIHNSREPNSAVQLSNFPTRKFAFPDTWESFVERFRSGQQALPQAWADLFGPLCTGTVDDLVVVRALNAAGELFDDPRGDAGW